MSYQNLNNIILAAQKESPIEWILQNKIVNERQRPIEFYWHYFLIDLYKDLSPIQVVRKSAQVGFSTTAILKSFWFTSMKDLNCIYVLPTGSDVSDFVSEKVNEIITHNPFLMELVADKDSIVQKKVGDRFIYYRGSFTEKESIIVSSDVNFYDELDRCSPSVIDAYSSRLQFSDYKYEYYFSNPTFPNKGVDYWWQKSDQKHYFIKCNHCGKWQYLTWEKNLDRKRKIFICEKCGKELTAENRRVGEWVKKWSNKDISGYWISQLVVPWQTVEELLDLEEKKSKQIFYNYYLGLPYKGSDVVVDKDLILSNVSTEDYETDKVFMGVDVGLTKYFVIGNEEGIFKIGKTNDWKDIENLIIKYNATCVIDAMPDITKPRRLMDKFRGKVFLNFYKNLQQLAEFKRNENYGFVNSDRTLMIEKIIDEHINHKIKYFIDPKTLNEYIGHWENIYRVEDEDRRGNKIVRWESAGDDHYVHAFVYWRIAKMKGTGEVVLLKPPKQPSLGEKSFEVKKGQIPAISVKEFIGKPEDDWRFR